jgi:peptide/nickel transport system ATP-binding protein
MGTENRSGNGNEALLKMREVEIDGFSDERWHRIIKGVDLTLHRGEVIGLIGESGAGKSTLGLAAMGFARAGCRIKSGTIEFDGIDLINASEQQKRNLWGSRIAYVAQSAAAAFNPAYRLIDQTIESVVRHQLRSARAARDEARRLYHSMDLPDPDAFGNRYPHQVSGGQLQRAMTAMAMASRPDLIILDEPTTALDVTTQVNVLAAIRQIVEKFHTAAIYITHDLAVVAQMAHVIKVLRFGETVEQSDTKTMLAMPKHPYTKSLWAVRKITKTKESSDEQVLRIEDIDAAYGSGPKVLHDVSISIPRGCTVSIVGESGSGKSTIARVVTGLLPPRKGRIVFAGKELPNSLENRSIQDLRRIQMIYQSADTAMNPRHTVHNIIGRPLELYFDLRPKEITDRVVELLEMIELDSSFIERLPEELSGGQKQRICIARSLAANPDVIICDEVTSSLDQIVQEGILRLLLRLQTEFKMSYLFITHDIATVRAISDEIVVLHEGIVVEQGSKNEVLSPPHPNYTQLLLSSVPEMDSNWLDRILNERNL